ncbi:hypothetical protein [Alteromonas portus]|uniref:hypothetical protein n=1 Tax=Alteromonas portus TaxID=2565549 RepID=UPI003BF89607
MKKIIHTVFAVTMLLTPLLAQSGIVKTSDKLNFETTGHSLWGNGNSFVGTPVSASVSWNETARLGIIAGSEKQNIPAIHDSFTQVIGQRCNIADWANDVCEALGGVLENITKTVRRLRERTGGVFDTRTGTALDLDISGGLSIESTLGINGGALDSEVGYDVDVSIDSRAETNTYVSLDLDAQTSDISYVTSFPGLTGELFSRFELEAGATAIGCIAFSGCTSSTSNLIDINDTKIPYLAINQPENDGQISLFGFDQATFDLPTPIVNLDAPIIFSSTTSNYEIPFDVPDLPVNADLILNPSGVPLPSLSIPGLAVPGVGVNVGTLTLRQPPNFITHQGTGDSLAGGVTVQDALELTADVDTLASFGTGAPITGGFVANVGPVSLRGDVYDISLGPTLDIVQRFNLQPELLVDLEFSSDVDISGQTTRRWSGSIADIPEFKPLKDGVLTIYPTYSVKALFSNETRFDFDFSTFLELFKLSAKVGPVELLPTSNPVFSMNLPVDLGSASLYNDSFLLSGFNSNRGSQLQITVPEPRIVFILLIGSVLIALKRRYKCTD